MTTSTLTRIAALVGLLGGLSVGPLASADQAVYRFGPDLSEAQACERATQRLKQEAVERQCGVQMAAALSRHRNDAVDSLDLFHFEMLGGAVVRMQQTHSRTSAAADGLGRQCRVEAELDVACHQGQRDPAFAPAFRQFARLNEQLFRDGEDLILQLRVETPLHLNVLQYLPSAPASQRLQVLYPNPWQAQNPLAASEKWQMPEGYRLQVSLPKGAAKANEYLILIATRHPLALPQTLSEEAFFAVLTGIPLEDRREALLPYQITAAGSATPTGLSALVKNSGGAK